MDMKLKQMLFTIRAMMDKTPEGEPLNLRISEIPDDFLSCWIVPDAGKYKPYFLEQKPIDELMNDIPLQVFIYAYGGRRYGKPSADLRDGKTVWLHFLCTKNYFTTPAMPAATGSQYGISGFSTSTVIRNCYPGYRPSCPYRNQVYFPITDKSAGSGTRRDTRSLFLEPTTFSS